MPERHFYEMGTIIIYLSDEEAEAQKGQMTSQVHIDKEIERAFKLSSTSLESLCPSHDIVLLFSQLLGLCRLFGGLDSRTLKTITADTKWIIAQKLYIAPSLVVLLATSPRESSADEVGGW